MGERAWKYLKKRLKELGLTGAGGVQRTKADCLQICAAGPIAVSVVQIGTYAPSRPATIIVD